MNKSFSLFLDASRWVAALVVMISHVRHMVLVDYAQVEQKNVLVQAFYLVTGLGHEAVMIFFVISGFLVGGITLKKWKLRGVNLRDYFAHRISRIYTVLLPALLVGWGLDALGLWQFNASGIYTNSQVYGIASLKPEVESDMGLLTFLGNLLMLETRYVNYLGTNGPVWSLAYEWWYYVFFAAFAAIYFARTTLPAVMGALCIAFVIAFAPLHMLVWGSIWLLGVVTFFYCESSFNKLPVWCTGALFLVSLAASRLSPSEPGHGSMLVRFGFDGFIGLSYALLVSSLYRNENTYLPWARAQKLLADFSYTLYLVHFPLLIVLVAGLHDRFGVRFLVQPDVAGLGYFMVLCAVLMGYAYGFSRLTEAHTQRVRAWLARLMRA